MAIKTRTSWNFGRSGEDLAASEAKAQEMSNRGLTDGTRSQISPLGEFPQIKERTWQTLAAAEEWQEYLLSLENPPASSVIIED
jgi:hypothetical protein